MNRQILKVSFNRFDADAQGGGNFLSGYMPILFHHLHNTGVNVFGLEFRVVGIYMQITAMEIVSGSKHKVREEGIQRVPVFVYAFSDICVVGSHKGVPEKAGVCGQWDNYRTIFEDLLAALTEKWHPVRSVCRRGGLWGKYCRFYCRIDFKSASGVFWLSTWQSRCKDSGGRSPTSWESFSPHEKGASRRPAEGVSLPQAPRRRAKTY